MSFPLESYDSLPYIDHDISQSERDKADFLITRELPAGYRLKLHPSLPNVPETKLSELVEAEVQRLQSGEPRKGGIDLSRYQVLDEPAAGSDIDQWRAALRNTYTSRSYLSGRQANLDLLDEYGKNAWLISNSQVEEIEAHLDQDLSRMKDELDEVNKSRKLAQENSRAEFLNLEESWKNGIGKTIEVQLATEGLRKEILLRRQSTSRGIH